MGFLGFFFKAELGQIWELFWSQKNVHLGFFEVVVLKGQI